MGLAGLLEAEAARAGVQKGEEGAISSFRSEGPGVRPGLSAQDQGQVLPSLSPSKVPLLLLPSGSSLPSLPGTWLPPPPLPAGGGGLGRGLRRVRGQDISEGRGTSCRLLGKLVQSCVFF